MSGHQLLQPAGPWRTAVTKLLLGSGAPYLCLLCHRTRNVLSSICPPSGSLMLFCTLHTAGPTLLHLGQLPFLPSSQHVPGWRNTDCLLEFLPGDNLVSQNCTYIDQLCCPTSLQPAAAGSNPAWLPAFPVPVSQTPQLSAALPSLSSQMPPQGWAGVCPYYCLSQERKVGKSEGRHHLRGSAWSSGRWRVLLLPSRPLPLQRAHLLSI